MFCVVNYGVGNLASIQNMLKRIGAECVVSSSEDDLKKANKLILPGVGAFDTCAGRLQQSGLTKALEQKVLQEKTPLIGVCVGMQLLLNGSEEGKLPGLGWIKGKNKKFDQSKLPADYKIPHMGWTDVTIAKPSKLTVGMESESRFYFVHSYHAHLEDH